jgi:hypothetical protein
MNIKMLKAAVVGLVLSVSGFANAGIIYNTELDENAYISIDGLDWAWANLVGGADLSIQAQYGWRIPTLADWGGSPLAIDFLSDTGNATMVSGLHSFNYDPNSTFTGRGSCAAGWFSVNTTCNWGNGQGQVTNNSGWYAKPGQVSKSHYEQLVVRESQQVPEPSTLAIFALGIMGLASRRFKKQ